MGDGKRKAVIYSRVSTEDQHTENQVDQLRSWGEIRGFYIVEVYQEKESAWLNSHQKEFNRLVTDAQRRRFDLVLVWALDRLSREGALSILKIINRLQYWGVHVLSYQEPWTEAPGELGELLYALTGWVARMESQRRSERTKAGIERRRREGKQIGRPQGSKDKKKRKKKVTALKTRLKELRFPMNYH